VSVDTAQLAVGSGVTVPAGQTTQMLVSIPFYATSPVTVILTSSDPTALTVPATVTIPQGGYYAYFAVTGVTAGSVSVSAHATGFRAATPVSVTVQ